MAAYDSTRSTILPDDTIVYRLYPVIHSAGTSAREHLTHLAVTYTHQIQGKLQGHIWYNDPFHLSPSVQEEQSKWQGSEYLGQCMIYR